MKAVYIDIYYNEKSFQTKLRRKTLHCTMVLVRDWRTLDCYIQAVQDILFSNSVAVCQR